MPRLERRLDIFQHLVLICTFLLVLVLIAAPASASSLGRWPQGQQTVCVQVRLSQFWGVPNAVRIWNAVGAGQPKFVVRSTCPYEGSVYVTDENQPASPYGGLTTVWQNADGTIRHADILMNDDAAKYLPHRQARHWKRYATGHEFGHALGLDHTYGRRGSIMCYCTNWFRNDGTLSRADRLNLRSLY